MQNSSEPFYCQKFANLAMLLITTNPMLLIHLFLTLFGTIWDYPKNQEMHHACIPHHAYFLITLNSFETPPNHHLDLPSTLSHLWL
jgi:hypothetical protein